VNVVVVGQDNNPTLNVVSLTAQDGGANQVGGSMLVKFAGIPGRNYSIQTTDSLAEPVVWTTVASLTAGVNGIFQYTDNEVYGHPTRFYRAFVP
jgi:hypothetical protein